MTKHHEGIGHHCSTLQVTEYVHKQAFEILQESFAELRIGRISELVAGSRALSLRLHDNGQNLVATELNPEDRQALVEIFQVDLNAQFSEAAVFTNADYDAVMAASYDVVIAVEVIEYLEDPSFFLREARKLLRSNGMLIFSVPGVFGLKQKLKVLKGYAPPYSLLLQDLLPEAGLEGLVVCLLRIPNFNWIDALKEFLLTRFLFRSYKCNMLESRSVYLCRSL
jgi:SAM-dependent methyltransferase